MASVASISNHALDSNDHNEVYGLMEPLKVQWVELGMKLGVPYAETIEAIDRDKPTQGEKLMKMLSVWLRRVGRKDQPIPSWRILHDAVETLDRNIADAIARDHSCDCHKCLDLPSEGMLSIKAHLDNIGENEHGAGLTRVAEKVPHEDRLSEKQIVNQPVDPRLPEDEDLACIQHTNKIESFPRVVDSKTSSIVGSHNSQLPIDEHGDTPLIAASRAGHEAIVDKLLKAGVDPSQSNEYGITPLIAASKGGYEAIVAKLLEAVLEAGVDPRQTTYNRLLIVDTPLTAACRAGHEGVVDMLLKAGADPSQSSEYGNTPLVAASDGGYKAIVDKLKAVNPFRSSKAHGHVLAPTTQLSELTTMLPCPWLYPNGTSKIAPVQKSSVDWYPADERQLYDVIGIDFGTSSLAVAYKVNGRVGPVHIQEESMNAYIPTVLLVMKNGRVEIGDRALQHYYNVATEDSIFFEQVITLHDPHNEIVSIETEVKGSDGKHYYVVEVIALILREVRRKLDHFFKARGGKYSHDDFHWTLTVPNFLGERARDMIRQAAYMACLCSDNPKWDELLSLPLKPSYTHKIPSIKEFESHPERLSLVYRADAAAVWCKQMSADDVKTINDEVITNVTTGNFFLAIDVEEHIIDVAAYQVLDQGRMKRINIPHGEIFGGVIVNREIFGGVIVNREIFGGATVNQAFQNFLEKEVVCDDGFAQYLSGPDVAENKAQLLEFLYIEFETVKKMFAENSRLTSAADFFSVQLPYSFAITYQTSLKQFENQDYVSADIVYKRRRQKLQIRKSKMSEFFDEIMTKLHKCICRARDAVVAEYGDNFSTFYLLGKFGGSRFVSENVRKAYSHCRTLAGRKVQVLVPQQHDLAAVKGACIYHDHQILLSADATYGVGVALPYDPNNEIHVRGTIKKNDEGVMFCHDLFNPIVHEGQELIDDVIYPLPQLTPSNRISFIQVYRSEANDCVNYVTGEDRRKLNVAELKISIPPEALELPRDKRTIEVLLDFTDIDIKVFARFKHTGECVSTYIDFLSTPTKFDLTFS